MAKGSASAAEWPKGVAVENGGTHKGTLEANSIYVCMYVVMYIHI